MVNGATASGSPSGRSGCCVIISRRASPVAITAGIFSTSLVVAPRPVAPLCTSVRVGRATRIAVALVSVTPVLVTGLVNGAPICGCAPPAGIGLAGLSCPTRDVGSAPAVGPFGCSSGTCGSAVSVGATCNAGAPDPGPAVASTALCTCRSVRGRTASSTSRGCKGAVSPTGLGFPLVSYMRAARRRTRVVGPGGGVYTQRGTFVDW